MLSLGEKETLEHKHTLRHDMRRTRKRMSSEHRTRASSAACRRLIDEPRVQGASVVAVYAAVRAEADPSLFAEHLWSRGRTVAYPRVQDGDRRLRFHRVRHASELVCGAFGIASPCATAPPVATDDIELVIVPGLAFDRDGGRLGWGHGYYDSTLARCAALRVGFGYDFQVFDRIPRSAHDVRMHMVVTDAQVVSPAPDRADIAESPA